MSAANEFNKRSLFIITNFDITEVKNPSYAESRYAVVRFTNNRVIFQSAFLKRDLGPPT